MRFEGVGGFAASMTPVTEPLWVLERLPGEAAAPLLRLLLITPDWVKACRSQTLSWETGKLDVTSASGGSSGNLASLPRRAVFALVSYICTCTYICATPHPPSYCALAAGGTVLPAAPATCRRRSQGISHATCHAFSHFSFSCCRGFFFFRLPPFNFPHKCL